MRCAVLVALCAVSAGAEDNPLNRAVERRVIVTAPPDDLPSESNSPGKDPAKLPDLDLVILVDHSESMKAHASTLPQFLNEAVKKLAEKTRSLRVGVLLYRDILTGAVTLRHTKSFPCAISFGGSSGALVDALEAVPLALPKNSQRQRMVLIVADEGSLKNKEQAKAAIKLIHERHQAKVFCIFHPLITTTTQNGLRELAQCGGGEALTCKPADIAPGQFVLQPDWEKWLKK